MARHKTKAQKKKSAQRRQEVGQSTITSHPIDSPEITTPTQVKQSATPVIDRKSDQLSDDAQRILGFPVSLLYRDLLKSAVITAVLLGLLVGIYVYIRYNGVALI